MSIPVKALFLKKETSSENSLYGVSFFSNLYFLAFIMALVFLTFHIILFTVPQQFMSIRIDKIYTKSGDKGTTRTVNFDTVSKASSLIECYGTLDELNSAIGLLRTLTLRYRGKYPHIFSETDAIFHCIQKDLFEIGVLLSQDSQEKELSSGKKASFSVIFIEKHIDIYREELPPLTTFILPGGNLWSAQAHVVRTTCRRCERTLVRWYEKHSFGQSILAYINRLSDLFFAYARWICRKFGDQEFLWDYS